MKPNKGCGIFGAYEAVTGINDGFIIMHSVLGCNFGTMLFSLNNGIRNLRQVSTALNDKDIIFSAEEKIIKTIEDVIVAVDPKVLFIISGCIPEIVGDDIKKIISLQNYEIPVIPIYGAGFKSDMDTGYENTMMQLKEYIVENKMEKSTINLIGLSRDDFRSSQDLDEIRKLLNGKVKINCTESDCSFEQFRNTTKAELNIVFHKGIELAKYLKEKYGIPYEEVDYPYGIGGIKNFLSLLEEKLDVNFSIEKDQIDVKIKEIIEKCYSQLESFYGIPVAVTGSRSKADGMKRFLEEELGFDVVVFDNHTGSSDRSIFYENVRQSNATIIFGSSLENEVSLKLDIPLLKYDYPIVDIITISNNGFIGVDGTVFFLETLINILNTTAKRSKRFF